MAVDTVFLDHFKLNRDFVKKETGLFLEGKTGMLEHGTLWYLFVLYRWYKRWIRA